MRERTDYLHDRTVAAQREHGVILAASRAGDFGRVAGTLGLHHVARHRRARKGQQRIALPTRALARPWVDDEKDATR